MKLILGSFTSDVNVLWLQISSRRDLGQTGGYMTVQHNWTIHHFIQAASLDALRTATLAFEAAVANITGDVIFAEDDGTATAHRITFGATVNGIRGVSASYPGGMTSYGGRVFGSGAEMADSTNTYRYQVTQISAREISFDQEIVFYSDSMNFSLGGTQFAVQGAFLGPPRRFNIMQQAPNTAVQQGRKIGMTGNPAAAAPLVSAFALDPQASTWNFEAPRIIGPLNQIHFPTSWRYVYRDPFPMPVIPPPLP